MKPHAKSFQIPRHYPLLLTLTGLVLMGCGGGTKKADEPTRFTFEEGEALLADGRFVDARVVFAELVAADRACAQCHYYLAVASAELGDTKKAEHEYRLALSFDIGLSEAHNNLGLLLLERGALTQAEAELHTYLRQNPQAADAYYNYALVLEAMSRHDEARKHYTQAATLAPADINPLLRRGTLHRKDGAFDSAIADFRQALEIDPQSLDAQLLLGQALLEGEQKEEGRLALEALTEHPDATAPVLTTAGALLADAEDEAAAERLYAAALERNPGYAKAHLLLANAMARGGRYQEAVKHYERYLAIEPHSAEAPIAQQRLSICREKLGR